MWLLQRLRSYGPADLRADLLAGLTVAAMFVPQAMAYGLLAGLPPVHGLYTAVAPVLVYAWIGRSRHMSVGPVAITALLVATGLEVVAAPGTAAYARASYTLAMMVGVGWIALGLLRAGVLVNFIGAPVIVGFNAAAALVTAASQVRPLLGIPRAAVPEASAGNPWPALLHLDAATGVTVAVGLGAVAALVVLSRLAPRVPGPLVVCIAGGLVSWLANLPARGLAVIGDVPRGLPPVTSPALDPALLRALLPAALSILVVGYASSITVVKALAARERERVYPNAELFALGGANLAGAFFGAFPASAGLSRSAVVARAGARSQLTTFVAGLGVMATLLWLAPIFRSLPLAVLAAIIVVSITRLFDVQGARAIVTAKRGDAATMVATFGATLGLGLAAGLATGLVLGLVLFVARTAAPHWAELGRIPGSEVYRNVRRFQVETCPQVGILRVDAPLYYANARFLEDRILGLVAERPDLKIVALECSSVGDMDATAVQTLRQILAQLRERGCDLHLVGAIGPVRDLLERSGLAAQLGAGNMHRTIIEAAPLWMAAIDRTYCTRTCVRTAFPGCERLTRDRPGTGPAPGYTPEI